MTAIFKQGTPEWHAARNACAATASEYGEALGVGYESRSRMMQRKLGLLPPKECNWRMQFGTEYENWVAEIYYRMMRTCGKKVRLIPDSFQHDSADVRLGGSIDRIVEDEETGERWVLEIKCVSTGEVRNFIPLTHKLQMMGLCEAYDLPYAHYIAWTPDEGVYLAEFRYDEELWRETIFPLLVQFANWRDQKVIPPRTSSGTKLFITDAVDAGVHIEEIKCIKSKRRRLEQPQTPDPESSPSSPSDS